MYSLKNVVFFLDRDRDIPVSQTSPPLPGRDRLPPAGKHPLAKGGRWIGRPGDGARSVHVKAS